MQENNQVLTLQSAMQLQNQKSDNNIDLTEESFLFFSGDDENQSLEDQDNIDLLDDAEILTGVSAEDPVRMYRWNHLPCRIRDSAFSQNGSFGVVPFGVVPFGVVFAIRLVMSFVISSSDRIYANGLYPSEWSISTRFRTITLYPISSK